MDRLKRPFSLFKTPKKDEPPPDNVPSEKSFRDKVDFFEKTVDSEDRRDAGKCSNNIIYVYIF